MQKISLEERKAAFDRQMEQKKRMEPNVEETTCPRCERAHVSLTEEMSGIHHNICDTCLTEKEKEEQGKFIREALFLKYERN